MGEIGKELKLANIFRGKKRIVNVAMDHCPVLGPIPGMEDPIHVVKTLSEVRPSAFMFHRGILKKAYKYLVSNNVPFILKLTTTTSEGPTPDRATLVDSVEEAVKFGASGVAIRFFMGPKYEPEMLKDLGYVSRECEKWGLPLFVMAYPEGFKNNYDSKLVKHVARLAAELGADVVKTYYTGSKESFKEVIETCPAPVVMAGGPRLDRPSDFLNIVKDALEAGAAGVMVGRNIWQADNPQKALKAIEEVVWTD